jgi:hypothetical protein
MSWAYRYFVSHKYPPLALVKRAYLPGECAALQHGIPVASDEELPEPADARLMPCYRNLLAAHGQTTEAHAVEQRVTAGLPPLALTLGSAHVLAAGTRGGKLTMIFFGGGAERGQLRYRLSRGGKTVTTLGASPTLEPPSRWQSGRLYVDEVGLLPGPWEVEAELIEPAPPQPPPISPAQPALKLPAPSGKTATTAKPPAVPPAPAVEPTLVAHAALGSLTR